MKKWTKFIKYVDSVEHFEAINYWSRFEWIKSTSYIYLFFSLLFFIFLFFTYRRDYFFAYSIFFLFFQSHARCMYIYIYIICVHVYVYVQTCVRAAVYTAAAVIGRVHIENVNGKQAVYGHERHLLDIGTHR